MGMHMALYSRTAGLPCEGMEINLVYNLTEEQGRKRIQAVTVDISLPQDPGERGAALLRAAQNCIVRNTLEKGPVVDVEITAGLE
jgi:uncharacterized OsmC-like protein